MSPILGIMASQISGHLASPSYESISTVTVGSGGAATITFSSIPATYAHLQIRGIGRGTAGGTNVELDAKFNSDSGANYANGNIYVDGATVYVFGGASQTYMAFQRLSGSGSTAGVVGTVIIDILDYANTNKYKTVRQLGGVDNNGSGNLGFNSQLWMNTNAISNIQLFPNSGNFAEYSSFALYGIKAA
jgi:hypothetical protein